MDLFVIVLCLSGERFAVHRIAHQRFHWFMDYGNRVIALIPAQLPSWIKLCLVLLPVLLLIWFVLHFIGSLVFGLVALVVNVAVFYYCLGPVNPFYPVHAQTEGGWTDDDVGHYLAQVNEELFAVLFWFLVLGPWGILAYRMIALMRDLPAVSTTAHTVLGWLDWLPVRMTALLYLLVGNFQPGFQQFCHMFRLAPDKNAQLPSVCGLAALDTGSGEQKTVYQAENLVEHATILFLVILAFCTIVAWV